MHGSYDDIRNLIEKYKKEKEELFNQITDIVYFTHGGVNWDQGWGLSCDERNKIVERIRFHLNNAAGENEKWM